MPAPHRPGVGVQINARLKEAILEVKGQIGRAGRLGLPAALDVAVDAQLLGAPEAITTPSSVAEVIATGAKRFVRDARRRRLLGHEGVVPSAAARRIAPGAERSRRRGHSRRLLGPTKRVARRRRNVLSVWRAWSLWAPTRRLVASSRRPYGRSAAADATPARDEFESPERSTAT